MKTKQRLWWFMLVLMLELLLRIDSDTSNVFAQEDSLHRAVYDAVVESSGGEVPTYFQFEYTRLDSVVSTGVWAKGGFITTNTTDAGAKGFLAHKLSDGWDVGILGDEKYGELWQQTPEDFYPSIREEFVKQDRKTSQAVQLVLPFALGEKWEVNGPHHNDGLYCTQYDPPGSQNCVGEWKPKLDRPWSAIDFLKNDGVVRAAASGKVVNVLCNGVLVQISHNGGQLITSYHHLRDRAVNEQDTVSVGDVLGYSSENTGGCGSADGQHVHFNIDGQEIRNYNIGGYDIEEKGSPYDSRMKIWLNGQEDITEEGGTIKNYGLFGCDSDYCYVGGELTGLVKWVGLNEPVVGLKVRLTIAAFEFEVTTDHNGRYRFPKAPAGNVHLYAVNQSGVGDLDVTVTANTTTNAPDMTFYFVGTCGSSLGERAVEDCGPPSTPGNLRQTGSTQLEVSLAWNDVSGEEKYELFRWNGSSYVKLATTSANTINYTDHSFFCGETKYYKVRAKNLLGYSPLSSQIAASSTNCPGSPSPSVPVAPSNLTTYGTTENSTNLSWSDNSNNESGFRLYWSYDGSNFQYLGDLSANQTSTPVTSLSCGWTFWFKLTAYNQSGESSPSNTVSVTMPSCPGYSAQLFELANFGGSVRWSGGPGFSNGPNADSYSLMLPPGYSVWVWEQDNRGGASRCFASDILNLQDHSWHLRIQSIEVFDHDVCPLRAAPPTNLHATVAEQNRIVLVWTDKSQDEIRFEIWRNGSGYQSLSPNTTTFEDTNVSCDTGYHYKVASVNNVGASDSNEIDVRTAPCSQPPQPSCTADNINYDGVLLFEHDYCQGELRAFPNPGSYNLDPAFRNRVTSTFLPDGWSIRLWDGLNQTGSTACWNSSQWYMTVDSYEDGTPMNDTVESIKIFTVPDCPSTLPPATPTDVVALDVGQDFIKIGWGDNSPDEDQFIIYKFDVADDSWMEVARVPANVTEYLDSGLTCGTVHSYKVSAINENGESWFSIPGLWEASTLACTTPPLPEACLQNPYGETVILFDLKECSHDAILWSYRDLGFYNLNPQMANAVSSLILKSGSVAAYDGKDESGWRTCINATQPNLSLINFDNGGGPVDNRIESIHLYDQPNCPGMLPMSPLNERVYLPLTRK